MKILSACLKELKKFEDEQKCFKIFLIKLMHTNVFEINCNIF